MPLAVLTDGLVWWLYLPTAEVPWEQRRFFHIDLREHEPTHVAEALGRFLNRDALVSGAALEEAKREFTSRERERRVLAALREAWNQVLSDPHGQLRALLAEAVKDISGHLPDPEVLDEFLLGVTRSGTTEVASPSPPRLSERTVPAGQDSSAPEQTDEAEDKTIVVTAAFARHVLTRLPLSRAMKKVLRALLDAHPDWLPPPALHRAAGYSKPAQFRGLMGAFGKRMANTEGYDPEAHFFEYRWNEDENVWECRLPDTVREALTLEALA